MQAWLPLGSSFHSADVTRPGHVADARISGLEYLVEHDQSPFGRKMQSGGSPTALTTGSLCQEAKDTRWPEMSFTSSVLPCQRGARRVLRVTSECVREHPHLPRVVPTYLHDRPASCMHSFLPSSWGFKGALMTLFIHTSAAVEQ